MIIVDACYEILRPTALDDECRNAILKSIEAAGRTCYKSECMATDESASKFVSKMVKLGHLAMLEHASMTVKWTVDIAVGREMTRHRLASYAQESTRYCNYSKDRFGGQITVVKPWMLAQCTRSYETWKHACEEAEKSYFAMLQDEPPESARTVLPLSTKAELVSTMNMREWRYFFQMRAADMAGKAHPQMHQVTIPLLGEMRIFLPEIFGDIMDDEAIYGRNS